MGGLERDYQLQQPGPIISYYIIYNVASPTLADVVTKGPLPSPSEIQLDCSISEGSLEDWPGCAHLGPT